MHQKEGQPSTDGGTSWKSHRILIYPANRVVSMTTSLEQIYTEFPALKGHYPEDVVRMMYEQMKPKRSLTDVTKGDWVDGAEVLVVKVMGTSGYVGCPNCYTKHEGVDEGISYECKSTKCQGAQRVATRLTKWVLLGSDNTTKVILDFPPFGYKLGDGNNLIAKVVSIRGRAQDPRENKDRKTGVVSGTTPVIQVKDLKILSDIRDGTATPVPLPAVAPKAAQPKQPTLTPPAPPPASAAKTPSASAPVVTTTDISAEKMSAFGLWMTFRTENGAKPVPEAQLKAYVENNLHIAFDSFKPYLDQIHTDSQGEVYRMKAKVPEP